VSVNNIEAIQLWTQCEESAHSAQKQNLMHPLKQLSLLNKHRQENRQVGSNQRSLGMQILANWYTRC